MVHATILHDVHAFHQRIPYRPKQSPRGVLFSISSCNPPKTCSIAGKSSSNISPAFSTSPSPTRASASQDAQSVSPASAQNYPPELLPTPLQYPKHLQIDRPCYKEGLIVMRL